MMKYNFVMQINIKVFLQVDAILLGVFNQHAQSTN